jgi:hypothetical protein
VPPLPPGRKGSIPGHEKQSERPLSRSCSRSLSSWDGSTSSSDQSWKRSASGNRPSRPRLRTRHREVFRPSHRRRRSLPRGRTVGFRAGRVPAAPGGGPGDRVACGGPCRRRARRDRHPIAEGSINLTGGRIDDLQLPITTSRSTERAPWSSCFRRPERRMLTMPSLAGFPAREGPSCQAGNGLARGGGPLAPGRDVTLTWDKRDRADLPAHLFR